MREFASFWSALHCGKYMRFMSMLKIVERQPPCPRATTTLAGFQAAEVGVSFNVSG